MREALQIVGEVGLPNMWATHKRLHEDLWRGLTQLGLVPFVERPADRLVTVNTIKARPPLGSAPALGLAPALRSTGAHEARATGPCLHTLCGVCHMTDVWCTPDGRLKLK